MNPSRRTALLLAAALMSVPVWAASADLDGASGDASAMAQAARQKAQAAAKEADKERMSLVPKTGHGSTSPYDYDIWQHNCHTAANTFLCYAPDQAKAGIVACGGDPTIDPAHHTFNWIVLPTQTCLYNWGTDCCWPSTAVPPNITTGPGRACAEKGCGAQYCTGTHCLPAGEHVERPSPVTCAILAMGGQSNGPLPLHPDMSPGRKPVCTKCCDTRSDMWTWDKDLGDKAKFDKEREAFRSTCKERCHAIFDEY